jgi:Uma2 family endonuclease
MTVMVDAERGIDIPELLDTIDAPKNWRVEYIEGEIIVSPSPSLGHEDIATSILRQLMLADIPHVYPAGLGYCMRHGCTDESKGNHVIPDLSVLSRAFTKQEQAAAELHKNWLWSDALDLVVEVTSSTPQADTVRKVRAYARMGVPYYLIVNRSAHEAVLLSKPTGDVAEPGYADRQSFAFGEPVRLPEPYPGLDSTTWQ